MITQRLSHNLHGRLRLRRALGALTVVAIGVVAPNASAFAVITSPTTGGTTSPQPASPTPDPTPVTAPTPGPTAAPNDSFVNRSTGSGPAPTAAPTTVPPTGSSSTSTTSPKPASKGPAPTRLGSGSGSGPLGWNLPTSMTVTPSVDVTAGDILSFTATITNGSWFDGGVSAHFWQPGPGKLSPISCSGNFDAGDTRTCSFQYTVSPFDMNRGRIESQVQWEGTLAVVGLFPYYFGTGAYAAATTNPARLALTKTAAPGANVQAGAVIQYTFAGQNTGRIALTNVGVEDPMAGLSVPVCTPAAPATLAIGATINCTANYTVTSADVANGSITNTASINGLDPSQRPITASANATVTTDRTPNLVFSKAASPTSGVVVNDPITYTFIMTNTGGTEFTNTQLSDPLAGLSGFTCNTPLTSPLPVGNGRTCTATVTVAQADVDAGSIVNTATVTGESAGGPVTRTASATVTAGQHPAIDVTVVADPATGLTAGSTINWTMTGHNIGDVTLTSDGLDTPMPGLVDVGCLGGPTLAPAAGVVCTGHSKVTQADVDAGSITNAVTFRAHDRYNTPLQASGSATAITTSTAALTLTKTASPDSGVHAGDVVTYSYEVLNTGTVTEHGANVTDLMPGLSELRCDPKAGSTLAPGSKLHCSATYRVTQEDVDAGSILNTGRVNATDPQGRPVEASGSATVTADTTATFSLEKHADPAAGVVAGQTITYTLTGRNTGAITLHHVRIDDAKVGLSSLTCTPALDADRAPGATMTCTGSYVTTQADIDAGSISNTAAITGLDSHDNLISATGSTIVTTSSKAEATFIKTANPAEHLALGAEVRYQFRATNTGDRSLINAQVADPLVGLSPLSCSPSLGSTLAPKAVLDCHAAYTVTQADVDAGTLTNTATFTATAGTLPPVTRVANATITTDQRTSLTLRKSAAPDTSVVTGSVVTYTLVATNAGTVTLHNVEITDPMPGLTPPVCSAPMPARLAPDASVTCTTTHTVTQADVDAGAIDNIATATARTPADGPATATDGATVKARQHSGVELRKTATPSSNVRAGDVVNYSFDGHNTGTVTVHDLNVTDPMPGLSPLVCSPTLPARLAATAPIHCAASYTVTQVDVDAGTPITNTATLSGTDPNGRPVGVSATASVTTNQRAGIALTKTANPSTGVGVGQTITYTYVATNTGTVTAQRATIVDSMAGLSPLTCDPGTGTGLGDAASMTCTATYEVTQTDVDAGSIINSATVTANTPRGVDEHATAGATVFANQQAAVDITKTATTGAVAVGSTVNYAIHVTNPGTVTLHNVEVTDALVPASGLTCAPTLPATLAPNAVLDCTATYTATQADIDAGTIVNTATVTGRDPQDNPISESAIAATLTEHITGVSLTKSATPTSGLVAGDRVTYTIIATNTGTVTLHNAAIADAQLDSAALRCRPVAPATLTPGATMTCTAEYRVTEADVDVGTITNVATVDASDPQDHPVSAGATKTILAGETAQLTVIKTATPADGVVAGSTIRYTIVATNTGTVALHDVGVADPMAGLSKLSCSPRTPATLAVGSAVRCTATAVITAADVAAGTLRNTATALGLDPVGNPTDAQGSASVDTSPTPPTPPAPPTPPQSPPGSNSRGSGTGGSGGSGAAGSGADGSGADGAGSNGALGSESGANGIGNATSDDRFVTNLGASRAPSAASGSEFDLSTTDIGRLGALGLVGVAGGWFVIAAGRRRRDDEDEDEERYDGFVPVTAANTAAPGGLPAAPTAAAAAPPAASMLAPLYLDRRQRRERRKLSNRLFHRDPSVDRRTEKRRQRRR